MIIISLLPQNVYDIIKIIFVLYSMMLHIETTQMSNGILENHI